MGQKIYFETRPKAYKGTGSPIQLLGFKNLGIFWMAFSVVLFCLSLRASLAEWLLLLYEFPQIQLGHAFALTANGEMTNAKNIHPIQAAEFLFLHQFNLNVRSALSIFLVLCIKCRICQRRHFESSTEEFFLFKVDLVNS